MKRISPEDFKRKFNDAKSKDENQKEFLLCVQEGAELYKLFKVAFYTEPGFYIASSSRFKDKSGKILMTTPPSQFYSDLNLQIPYSETVGYFTSGMVKLSVHKDGFVQFSSYGSHKIRSGRLDGVGYSPIKGAGIYVDPLKRPYTVSPFAGISAWGIENFEKVTKKRDMDKAIVFKPSDIYPLNYLFKERRESRPNDIKGYKMDVFLFPYSIVKKMIKEKDGKYILSLKHNNNHIENVSYTYRILPFFKHKDYCIGIRIEHETFGMHHDYGFSISTLSGLLGNDKNKKRVGFNAIFPIDATPNIESESIDFASGKLKEESPE